MTLRYLTANDLAHMTPAVRQARIDHWRAIIADLRDDHWRRYPDSLRGLRKHHSFYPVFHHPLDDFDGVGATLARGFRESA